MIFSVILYCIISAHIEARTIKAVYIMGQERGIHIKRIRDQNDVYGAETIPLNGRSPTAPSWPEAISNNEKMFLLPKILEVGDEVKTTVLISRKLPHWVSFSLITERVGPYGTEPDYNNIACQLYIKFDSNEGKGSVTLHTIQNEITEEYHTALDVKDLLPELQSSTTSEEIIRLTVVVNHSGSYGVEVYIGESYIDKISLKHNLNDIRYIALDGAVDKVKRLDFLFN